MTSFFDYNECNLYDVLYLYSSYMNIYGVNEFSGQDIFF